MPRYSSHALPAGRFVPGQTARPEPGSHAAPPVPAGWEPDDWRRLDAWLWAVDLFNAGYWWECHETLEALWHAAGRTTPPARFVQALIHLSAACLNDHRGRRVAARRQAARAVRGLRAAHPMGPCVMGVALDPLAVSVVRAFSDRDGSPSGLRILLEQEAQ
ncbi:MAG TPA: DUF309 domain-containing protein [Gemmatimonadota bacterium]|nr:DUF309 domain-containing protein [Gemmatimonadota bacterium]